MQCTLCPEATCPEARRCSLNNVDRCTLACRAPAHVCLRCFMMRATFVAIAQAGSLLGATCHSTPTPSSAAQTKGKGKKIKNLLQATTNPMKQCHKLAVNGKWVTKVCTCSSLPRFYCDDGCFLKAQWVRRDPRTRCSRECGGGWQTYNYRCEGYWYQQTCGGSWSQLSAIYVMRITCYPLEVELAQRLF